MTANKTSSAIKKIPQFLPDSTFYDLEDGVVSSRGSHWKLPVLVEVDKKNFAIGHHENGDRNVYFNIKELVAAYGILGGDLHRLADIPLKVLDRIKKKEDEPEKPEKAKKKGKEAATSEIEPIPIESPKTDFVAEKPKIIPSNAPKQISLF